MDIRFTPVSEVAPFVPLATVTDLTRLKGTLTAERSWPFRLTSMDGSFIYLNVYESELRAVLKQMSDVVEGL